MKAKNRTYSSDVAGQWQQAIRGDAQARTHLLRRIMPARSYHPKSR
jgi:hypothetical protein